MNKINWMNKDRVLARQIACALLATGIGVVSGLVVTEVAWNWGIGTAGAVTAWGLVSPATNLLGVIVGTAAGAILAVIFMAGDW